MIKTNIFRICMIIILFAMCFTLINVAMATAGCGDCNNPATSAGNAEFPCSSTGAKLTIVATYSDITATDKETISPTRPVTLKATGGRPPYTWSTTSKGYSLSKTEGETITLSVNSGTCGTDYDIYATVTVSDNCPTSEPKMIEIRNGVGYWKTLATDCDCRSLNSDLWAEAIIGHIKYVIRYYYQDISSGYTLVESSDCSSISDIWTDCEPWLDADGYNQAMSDGHCAYWKLPYGTSICWRIGTYKNNTSWGYTTRAIRYIWSCP